MRVASWPKIGSPTERSAWAKASMSRSARDVAGLEVHGGDAVVVAAQEADQDLGVDPAGVGVDPAHDAEVERDQRAVGPELEVALVHVGVEEAVAERVGQEGLDDALGEPHQVGAAGLQRRQVAHVDAARPFQGQHPAAGGGPDHRGHPEARVAGGVGGELGGGGGLHPEVELALDDALEVADHRLGAQAPGEGGEELDHAGGEVEGVDVAQERALDAGAQHLDRDGLAGGAQRGAVDLGERGGGDRRLEVGEDRVERLAELELDGARAPPRSGRAAACPAAP